MAQAVGVRFPPSAQIGRNSSGFLFNDLQQKFVRSAGAGGDADAGRAVMDPGIAFRRDGRRLLMVIVGDREARLMTQGVVEVHGSSADHAECPRDAALHQLLRNIVAEFYPHGILLCS